jgi:hypothetical protein
MFNKWQIPVRHGATSVSFLSGLIALCLLLLATAHCAPDPKSVPCTDDAECQQRDPKLVYCANSYCVECVTELTCDEGEICAAGVCEKQARASGPSRSAQLTSQ